MGNLRKVIQIGLMSVAACMVMRTGDRRLFSQQKDH